MEGDSATSRSSARDRTIPSSTIRTKFVNLALQSSGADGAFTLDVLDRLLDDEHIAFDGVSATSAGAMNAAVFAYGLAAGEREGAKKRLAGSWRRIGNAVSLGPLQPTVFRRIFGNEALAHSPIFAAIDFMSRLFSPYELSPLNLNPLRDVLLDSIDFAALEGKTCPINFLPEEARRAKDPTDVRPLYAP